MKIARFKETAPVNSNAQHRPVRDFVAAAQVGEFTELEALLVPDIGRATPEGYYSRRRRVTFRSRLRSYRHNRSPPAHSDAGAGETSASISETETVTVSMHFQSAADRPAPPSGVMAGCTFP
jgi:hypothetical protein